MVRPAFTPDNPLFRGLCDSRRRRTIRLLADRTSPVGVPELATHLAAEEQDEPLVTVAESEMRERWKDLVHHHLPRLADVGVVEWDRREGTVSDTDHPALVDPKLREMIEMEAPGWDGVLENLAYERRRIVLSVLKQYEGEIPRAKLAKAVDARERDGVDEDRVTDGADDLLISLHHTHLPKLEEAGLVTYDPAAGTVAYEGHSALDEEWLDFRPGETPRAILPDARNADDVWTIVGRDNVIARGQSLFEQAEEELFLMFTTSGLLEGGCIRRLEDAIDRGVEVYLGSRTPAVRDMVRERLPGAVIWEPQRDWCNLPQAGNTIGRLVFADRTAIMLATLGGETAGGSPSEIAITGAGENNPLVVLVSELLGSRLDHLDAQSEDFLSQIPF